MRNRSRKLAALASIATLATMAGLMAPAGAGPTVLTGNGNSLAAAGSDTTYFMMQAVSPAYNVDKTKNLDGGVYNTANADYVTQIPPLNNAPFPAGTFVPGDGVTGSTVWDSSSAPVTPPNGSGAGVTALTNDTTGAIDFVRSSSGPAAGGTAIFNYWAYALGAVDYVTFPGTHAPAAGLTTQQLINIYTCNASGPNIGKPIISNWSQVAGNTGAGAIVKYIPQANSGTRNFFQSKLLGGNTIDANCSAGFLSTPLEEHDARGVTAASKPNAIYVYDFSKWKAQATGFEANLRNGAALGKVGTTTSNRIGPSLTTVNTTPSRFFGTRYVFNVVKKTSHPVSYTTQQADVEKLIGVRTAPNGGPGLLCNNTLAPVITLSGFVPLTLANTGAGLPQSYCRLNPPAL